MGWLREKNGGTRRKEMYLRLSPQPDVCFVCVVTFVAAAVG